MIFTLKKIEALMTLPFFSIVFYSNFQQKIQVIFIFHHYTKTIRYVYYTKTIRYVYSSLFKFSTENTSYSFFIRPEYYFLQIQRSHLYQNHTVCIFSRPMLSLSMVLMDLSDQLCPFIFVPLNGGESTIILLHHFDLCSGRHFVGRQKSDGRFEFH